MKPSDTQKLPRPFARRLKTFGAAFLLLFDVTGALTPAAQLKPETAATFDHYIAVTESRMNDDIRLNQFLIIDRLPEERRKEAYDQLQMGAIHIEELHVQEDHHSIRIPSGLVHHWAGVIFIPKVTLSEVDAVLQDYDHEAEIYKPDILRARLIEQNGNGSKIFLQFYSKTIVTVVLNEYSDVVETHIGSTRIQSASRSTRIAEVVNAGSADEHERTDAENHGYMWRLYSYWRLEEKDGGVYVQNESITLSRTVPVMLAWLIGPLTKSIPRDVLFRTLTNTKKAAESSWAAKQEGKTAGTH